MTHHHLIHPPAADPHALSQSSRLTVTIARSIVFRAMRDGIPREMTLSTLLTAVANHEIHPSEILHIKPLS